MKPREDVARFIEDQLKNGTKRYKDAYGYGLQELRDLLDYLYESTPKNPKEELYRDDQDRFYSEQSEYLEQLQKEIINLPVGCSIEFAYSSILNRPIGRFVKVSHDKVNCYRKLSCDKDWQLYNYFFIVDNNTTKLFRDFTKQIYNNLYSIEYNEYKKS